ncbi:hypothetical protein KDN24_18355 [Bacillus sp. Bva_UNVM-123]|uniref:hypothetical protein n=1 Tax=Bacillus sp. Bva_UNVM-123 TaxID=2829798 RepID=UPI00391FC154
MKKILIYNLLLLFILVGCSSAIHTNPTARSILKEDSRADILQYNQLIYINATNLKIDGKAEFTKDEKLGEIMKTTTSSKNFKDFFATQLPIGTEIYSTNDNNTYTIIAKVNGKEILYTVLLEG